MSRPVSDYALISDCQGAALVSRSGVVEWGCLPRFDSPATFCALLDPSGGHWSISPRDVGSVRREYVRDSMALRTTFEAAGGVVALTDALALGEDERGHDIGRRSPHAILRVVECLQGAVEIEVELAIRGEYGLTVPVLEQSAGAVRARGGPLAYLLSGDVEFECQAGTALAKLKLTGGERRRLALRVCSPWEPLPDPWDAGEIERRLDQTIDAWRSWSALHQTYDGPYAELVRHSGMVLQALTYAPTGAVVAAPTTSLPETVGGERNWDYRFCWVRDASLTLEALWVAACPDEAGRFFDFFATAAGGTRADHSSGPGGRGGGLALQIMYGVGGERLIAEHELGHLGGWRGSRPVRVGNGAWDQLQLDVYGELLAAAELLAPEVGQFSPATARFLIEVADTAAARWQEPDQGIWEVRGGPRHFLYSKLMCWAALDRALRLAPRLGAQDRVKGWTRERERIREAILQQGWSERAGAYAQAFGSDVLDASALMLAIVGLLPADDPRMRATIEAIAERLTDERGFVYRYRDPDGLEGEEGTFVICTFWLVRCLAMLGQVDRARSLFERVAGLANDVGLLSEEIDPHSRELIGNFPQAFSHIGLINAAWSIALAEGTVDETAGPTRAHQPTPTPSRS